MNVSIVGAGISGLATAYSLLAKEPESDITLFEAGGRTGGKVWTEISSEGYLCEGGVNGFLDKVPDTLKLCDAIGLPPLRASAEAEKRYVFSQGKLHKLPEKPPEFFSSRLLSLRGRLRVVGELFAHGTDKADETLAEFGVRRLGREAFERLIDPMASGVFAGDATQMSLKSCFPRIHEVEAEYGSLIRGLVKLQLQAKKSGGDGPGPGPGGRLTSFAKGMSAMTDTLSAGLASRIRTNCEVSSVSQTGGRYTLQLNNGEEHESEFVILAAPAWAQANMLHELDPGISGLLREIPYPSLAVVCFGYGQHEVRHILDGFGFLVPSRERRSILGTVVDSSVFPGRAPEGSVLLRSMVGGARRPGLAELPDEPLISLVQSELSDILRLKAEPDFVRIFRHQRAIPQYLVGHEARLQEIDRRLCRHPGLFLTGNAFRGVSLNDCVVNAEKTAVAAMQSVAPHPEPVS